MLGFNSGCCDLNLVKEHLAKYVSEMTKKVRVAKDANKTMYLLLPGFRFLDIINYLGPRTSYDRGEVVVSI